MAIEVGKDVVAIRDHSQGIFKKGQIFKCLAIKEPYCNCYKALIDIGIKDSSFSNFNECYLCGASFKENNSTWWLNIDLFRALDDITPSIEEIIKEIAPLELTQV